MYVGLGLFLLVVGGILSFAVQDRLNGVDLTMVGYICIAGGVLAIILSLLLNANSRRDDRPRDMR